MRSDAGLWIWCSRAGERRLQGATDLYLHDISLYAPGGIVSIRAGFSDILPIAGLLGMSGFFEFFKMTFDPTALRVELERIYRA
jgi:hypothetical protein